MPQDYPKVDTNDMFSGFTKYKTTRFSFSKPLFFFSKEMVIDFCSIFKAEFNQFNVYVSSNTGLARFQKDLSRQSLEHNHIDIHV